MITMQVTGQIIRPVCCEKIVSDSINMLEIKFTFSNEWKGMTKTAQFTQVQEGGTTYTYNVMLDSIGAADIPNEITHGTVFISVFGVLGEKRMTTAPLAMPVEKSGYISDGDTPIPPTPDLYQQIIDGFNTGMAGKADAQHTHKQGEIEGLVNALFRRDRVRDLMDNGYMLEAINQRGATTTTAWKYCIDRWISWIDGIGISVNSDGLHMTGDAASNAFIYQKIKIPVAQLLGKTVTLAVCDGEGNIACKSVTLPATAPTAWRDCIVFNLGNLEAGIFHSGSGNNGFCVKVGRVSNNTDPVIVRWVALYEGDYTAESLPPYTPKGYAAELLECQRYYYRMQSSWRWQAAGICSSATYARIPIRLPVSMRAMPTVTIPDVSLIKVKCGAGSLQIPTAIEWNKASEMLDIVEMTATVSGATGGAVAALYFENGGIIEFAADL